MHKKPQDLNQRKSTHRWSWLAAVAIAAATLAQTVQGVPIPPPKLVITFTEYSSTNLTASYTNTAGFTFLLSVVTLGPDIWSVSAPTAVIAAGGAVWNEPTNPNLLNRVVGSANRFLVTSDGLNLTGATFLTNNAISSNPIGFDFTSGRPISVYGVFNDLGAVHSLPDPGSTLPLLGLGLVGVGFLRRKPFT